MGMEYEGREQTQAKHGILRGYLGAFANKLIKYYDIAYIDGFSGPWEEKSEDFSDTSFGIAVEVILQAQKRELALEKTPKKVRCFFVEKKKSSYKKLSGFLAPYNSNQNFEVKDFCGEFEDAIPTIDEFIKGYFPLCFIDPKGWTGFDLAKMKPLLIKAKSEVLINFMYEFIQRGVGMSDEKTVQSFDGLFGGSGWKARLDCNLSSGDAALKLFKENLKLTGNFKYVADAEIMMSTKDRPHYYLVYGTKSYVGLQVFRHQQFKTRLENEQLRLRAARKKVDNTQNTLNFLTEMESSAEIAGSDETWIKRKLKLELDHVKSEATDFAKDQLSTGKSFNFEDFAGLLLESFVLKETHAKDICVTLAKEGFIEHTWAMGKNAKPDQQSIIRAIKT